MHTFGSEAWKKIPFPPDEKHKGNVTETRAPGRKKKLWTRDSIGFIGLPIHINEHWDNTTILYELLGTCMKKSALYEKLSIFCKGSVRVFNQCLIHVFKHECCLMLHSLPLTIDPALHRI